MAWTEQEHDLLQFTFEDELDNRVQYSITTSMSDFLKNRPTSVYTVRHHSDRTKVRKYILEFKKDSVVLRQYRLLSASGNRSFDGWWFSREQALSIGLPEAAMLLVTTLTRRLELDEFFAELLEPVNWVKEGF